MNSINCCYSCTIQEMRMKAIVGLRPTPEEETAGLDLTDHQEEGYVL